MRRRAQCLIEASGLAGSIGPERPIAAKERDAERAQGAGTRDRPGDPFAVRRVAGRRGLADRRSVVGRSGPRPLSLVVLELAFLRDGGLQPLAEAKLRYPGVPIVVVSPTVFASVGCCGPCAAALGVAGVLPEADRACDADRSGASPGATGITMTSLRGLRIEPRAPRRRRRPAQSCNTSARLRAMSRAASGLASTSLMPISRARSISAGVT